MSHPPELLLEEDIDLFRGCFSLCRRLRRCQSFDSSPRHGPIPMVRLEHAGLFSFRDRRPGLPYLPRGLGEQF